MNLDYFPMLDEVFDATTSSQLALIHMTHDWAHVETQLT